MWVQVGKEAGQPAASGYSTLETGGQDHVGSGRKEAGQPATPGYPTLETGGQDHVG
jgi:hypothetical protein